MIDAVKLGFQEYFASSIQYQTCLTNFAKNENKKENCLLESI